MFLMTADEVNIEIGNINSYLSKCLWMDFEICQLNGGKIVVAGRIDTSYDNYSIDIELASDKELIEMNRQFVGDLSQIHEA